MYITFTTADAPVTVASGTTPARDAGAPGPYADGLRWQVHGATDVTVRSVELTSIAHGNGRTVVAGRKQVLVAGDSGPVEALDLDGYELTQVLYDGRRFIGAGIKFDRLGRSYAALYTSADGKLWTEIWASPTQNTYAGPIRLIDGELMAVINNVVGAPTLIRSAAGAAWEELYRSG